MFNKIFQNIINLRFVLNPIILYDANNLGDYVGTSSVKRTPEIVVTLLYDNDSIDELSITLYSILNQKIKPDKIILWVPIELECSNINDLPYSITRFIKNGLQICFIRNLYTFSNIYYSFKNYSESIIVLAENNVYYKRNWLEKLYYSYIANPNDIQAHKSKLVALSTSKTFLAIKNWVSVSEESVNYLNFFNIYSGILFPPNCFASEILRYDVYKKYANDSKSAWLWIMALLNDRKIRVIKNRIKFLYPVNIFKFYKKIEQEYINLNKGLIHLKKIYGPNISNKI